MPFAELPSSGGFQAPQAPDWTQFGRQANELIAHQPQVDLSSSIQQAVGQIDEILKMTSPEGRLERKLKIESMSAMVKTYQDYKEHPDNYILTAHGPVHKDVDTELLKGAHIKQAMTATALNMEKLRQAQRTGSTGDFINGLRSKASNFFGSKDYGSLPVNSKEAPTAVGGGTPDSEPDLAPVEVSPVETPATDAASSEIIP